MRHWLIAVVVLVCIIAVVGFTIWPDITNAPTRQGPGETAQTPSFAVLGDVIEVDAPLAQTKVTSPLTISGKARGSWYFEATAPVELKDSSGTVIAHGTIRAEGSWTTTDYVPFTGVLTFAAPTTQTGTLVLKNDNPSGDPKKQKELDIPVSF